jgi:GNAT superfamily N-acetyltransferase
VPQDISGQQAATDVRLRPYRPADLAFLQTLYATTRAGEMAFAPWPEEQKAAFLRQQLNARETHYAAEYAGARNDVVLVDGRAVGRLMVDRSAAEVWVIDIALLPEHRGRGVGSRLLGQVMDESTSAGLPVRLHTDPGGAARRLYLRLGFVSVHVEGFHELMERHP